MLRKFKTWTYNNFHLIIGIIFGGTLFYFSLKTEWLLIIFFIVFFFLNLYFLKGAKLAIATFLAPLPFLLLQPFFNLSIFLLTLIWLIGLIFLWTKERAFWFIFMFLIFLLSQFILGNNILHPFFVILSVFLISFITTSIEFTKTKTDAFVKSFILSEVAWLVYFLPIGFIIRAVINFIIFYLILKPPKQAKSKVQ